MHIPNQNRDFAESEPSFQPGWACPVSFPPVAPAAKIEAKVQVCPKPNFTPVRTGRALLHIIHKASELASNVQDVLEGPVGAEVLNWAMRVREFCSGLV